jgi:glutamine amidotransferase
MIAVIDYGRGNLFSISQALSHQGAEHMITTDADTVAKAEKIILPGVGAFGDGMEALKKSGLDQVIQQAATDGTPILGVCLGMQLMASRGLEFGEHQGLGLIEGTVKCLPEGNGGVDSVRIPNVGWRILIRQNNHAFLDGLPDSVMTYFVHSYAFNADRSEDVTLTIAINGAEITAGIHRDNLYGYQFHPEKSGSIGLEFIERFLNA